MLLKRFYDDKLAQASYMVGCQATGEAIVIDANRDIEQYVAAARAEGLRITHVTETHIHADFVSGSRELAAKTAARLHLSDEGDADWKYAFAAESGADLLHDGDSFMVGNIRFDVMHTPGHTPEHLSFMVTDTPATDRPMGVFTGDFIFVGDVGRPDLLERAAGLTGTMEDAARILFASINRFRSLPDYLQLWPGHGAGSACGKSLGAIPSTTLGYEKVANPALGIADESRFVEWILEDQPEPPAYFAEMKRVNKRGPAVLDGFREPVRLDPARFRALLDAGTLIADIRPAAEFASAHIPGTINIPLNKSFTTWAGSLIPYDAPFYLIGDESASALNKAARDLAMIGLDDLGGTFGSEVLRSWEASGGELARTPQVDVAHLDAQLASGATTVIDVRGHSEWKAGHIAGVQNIPLGSLAARMANVPRTTPIVVHCQGGGRSAIAASVLRASGFQSVANVSGGFAAWESSGRPVERDAATAASSAA